MKTRSILEQADNDGAFSEWEGPARREARSTLRAAVANLEARTLTGEEVTWLTRLLEEHAAHKLTTTASTHPERVLLRGVLTKVALK